MSTASAIRNARAFKRAEYGPGDEQTWGPVVDPRDPRYEPTQDDEDATEAEQAMRDCEETLGRAQRALLGGGVLLVGAHSCVADEGAH